MLVVAALFAAVDWDGRMGWDVCQSLEAALAFKAEQSLEVLRDVDMVGWSVVMNAKKKRMTPFSKKEGS